MSKYVEYGDEKIPIEEALERMDEEIGELQEERDKYKQVLIKIKKFTEVPINCDGQAEDILDKIIKTLEEIE